MEHAWQRSEREFLAAHRGTDSDRSIHRGGHPCHWWSCAFGRSPVGVARPSALAPVPLAPFGERGDKRSLAGRAPNASNHQRFTKNGACPAGEGRTTLAASRRGSRSGGVGDDRGFVHFGRVPVRRGALPAARAAVEPAYLPLPDVPEGEAAAAAGAAALADALAALRDWPEGAEVTVGTAPMRAGVAAAITAFFPPGVPDHPASALLDRLRSDVHSGRLILPAR